MKPFVLTLIDPQVDMATAGGKGMSLTKLARGGFPVPNGFHVTTEAYRCFVSTNALQPIILHALELVNAAQPTTAETASQEIGRVFAEAVVPNKIEEAISMAYDSLAPGTKNPGIKPLFPVAVRSSATAEDLPEASFAGQHDTYLNISGIDAVVASVQKCWASLWTGRAIAYRLRQGISPESIALAVVVQLLVPAEAAGVLFTANPITGKRSEAVINAAWGLGESIVGGMVTPDTLTVDKFTYKVVKRETSEKEVMTVRTADGTTQRSVPVELKNKPVLKDEQGAELTRYGVQIENLYGMPMDIEWTLADGKWAIVQARPITNLVEAPLEWQPPNPKGIYMRGSVVDLMPDPLSPLFTTLAIPALIDQMYPLGKKVFRSNPILPENYYTIINNYAYMNAGFSFRGWVWVLFGMLPAFPRLLRIMVPFWREEALPKYQEVVAGLKEVEIDNLTSANLWQEIKMLVNAAAYYTDVLMFATMGASAGSEGLLTRVYDKMVRQVGDPPATVLLMGWDNIPIRAEKSLYDVAMFCKKHELLQSYLLQTPSEQISTLLTGNQIPVGIPEVDWQEFCQCFNIYILLFGYMIFELDFAKPLPRDHFEPMLEVVKMYLRGEGKDPYVRQRSNEEMRIRVSEQVLARLKGFRRWVFIKALKWAQSLSEVREDALAEIGLGYPVLRRMLLILGKRFGEAGVILDASDIFWLEKNEVDKSIFELDKGMIPTSFVEGVIQRKAFWQKAKRSVPPPMVPHRNKVMGFNTAIWLPESEANQIGVSLKGVPASPGRVTAPACILNGPEDFDRMRPGDVLVAGTTTPAWTPLFAMASAVVTDIGGPLSHGSIVAREYGIPSVMGTGVATRRIKDGQMVTVDGGAGTVTLL